jgi:3-oxoacyl-[acyl-carrier protein] reductase
MADIPATEFEGAAMDLGLNGRVALVAAASRGLGKAVATVLAEEGARVAIFSRHQEAIDAAAADVRRATGAEVLPLAADVNRSEDLERVVRATVDRFGRLDILVNNAGGPPPGTFATLSDEQWQQAVNLTLMSVIRLTRLALPHLRTQGGGRIINLTSSSTREPIANLMLSNAIRSAVAGWAKTLATELAPENILVNCVAPGRIATERLQELDGANAQRQGRPVEEVRRANEAAIPLGRYGRPEEFAAAVAFLAGDRASYITGTTLYVDGGKLASVL